MGTAKGAISPRTLFLAVGLIAVPSAAFAFAAATSGFQSKAKDTLFRCIEKGSLTTMTAIVVQKGGTPTCPPSMTLKIAQDKSGNKSVTILQPLSMQNMRSVKNGSKMTQYYPDENRVVVQPAPKLDKEDLKIRMTLAEQNYRFAMEGNGPIAGRETIVVTATPKYPDMPVRRYSIDVEKDVLLRMETIDEGGRKNLVFDTQAIWYPKSLPDETFQLRTVGRVRVINVPGPTKIESASMARAQAGIDPVIPRDLPFGFVVRDPQLAGDEGKRFIAVRITDGLLTATVYQWDGRLGALLGRDELGMDRGIGPLRIRLVGELPMDVHSRLLDMFIKEAAKVFRPNPEPSPATGLFTFGKKPRGDGGKDSAPDHSNDPDGEGQVDEALMQTLASFLTVLQAETAA